MSTEASNTMKFADIAIEAAVKQVEKRYKAIARTSFEHGFRLGEKGGHNLQSAMETYDRLMAAKSAETTMWEQSEERKWGKK